MEQEYKFSIDSEAVWLELQERLYTGSSFDASMSFTVRDLPTLMMASAYFDTEERLLRERRIVLRQRRENDRVVLTYKSDVASDADGFIRREEVEHELERWADPLILSDMKDEFLAQLPPDLLSVKQSALFDFYHARFQRTRYLLESENTRIEVALDKGELCNDRHCVPVCELELELLTGDETRFHQLAVFFRQTFGLHPEYLSKLARCIALDERTT